MSELFEEISSGTGKFNSIYFCLRQNRSVAPVSVGQDERCADTSTLLPHTHHGSRDEPWTAAKGLWRSAAALWVGTRYSVRGNPKKQAHSGGIRRPDLVARDAEVQRRLAAEPGAPVLQQIYS